jgi:hypothetical protein
MGWMGWMEWDFPDLLFQWVPGLNNWLKDSSSLRANTQICDLFIAIVRSLRRVI